ncbi:c6 zinc finger domain protein [Ophiostoma piceae UAMH 11346]|uniref:C6 zinc finger domain protein n=1 Tax=Ophiostoma piceae (strain UAMH 11346) TaxID=1262450 RepID=S3CBL0_OPHP1|nr:c6 zinc finger domain protein [Ophiostoma piceae UAMH 11346]
MVNTDGPEWNKLFYGPLVHHIPNRLGRKATLDSAFCSFAMHLRGKSRNDDRLVIQSCDQSLAALQAALNHPVEWLSSDTMCTAMVLCFFKLFADTSGASTGWQILSAPEDAPPSPYSAVFTDRNPWIASVYLGYAMCMLIIQDCINHCSLAQSEAAEATMAAVAAAGIDIINDVFAFKDFHIFYDYEPKLHLRSILISHATAPRGAFGNTRHPRALRRLEPRTLLHYLHVFREAQWRRHGPYRLGFCMHVSYEFANVHAQLWIQALLHRSSKVSASARTNSYQPPGQNEYNYN